MKNQINQLFIALFFIYGSLLTSCRPEGDKGAPDEKLIIHNHSGYGLSIFPYSKDSILREISIAKDGSYTIDKDNAYDLGDDHCAYCLFSSLDKVTQDSAIVEINNKQLLYTRISSSTSNNFMSSEGYVTKQTGDYEYTHEYFFTQEHVDSAK